MESEGTVGKTQPSFEKLYREHRIYMWLAIISIVVGFGSLLVFPGPGSLVQTELEGTLYVTLFHFANFIRFLTLLTLIYATIRFARVLRFSVGEWILGLVLILAVYVGSVIYMMYKSNKRMTAHMEGEPSG